MPAPSRQNRSLREIVADTVADHPVSVCLLFGSEARGEAHAQSDIDVAVAFADSESTEAPHIDARLALGADLALAVGTDDIDVIDLDTASPSLVRAVLRDGERLVGNEADIQRLRETLRLDVGSDQRSPAERFDDALRAIDDHLA
jgi:predicted nucleotidyltransferase